MKNKFDLAFWAFFSIFNLLCLLVQSGYEQAATLFLFLASVTMLSYYIYDNVRKGAETNLRIFQDVVYWFFPAGILLTISLTIQAMLWISPSF